MFFRNFTDEPRDFCCFFFKDTATTKIYTLSLLDALPISFSGEGRSSQCSVSVSGLFEEAGMMTIDRKSTRLNSSHSQISYAVFSLKKKKKKNILYQYLKKKNKYITKTKIQ